MRIETPKWIASERIVWLRDDDSEVEMSANIGLPYQVNPATWACPVALAGVDHRYPDIHGASSLQSLCLAIQLLASRLDHMLKNNAHLVYAGDRTCKWDSESFFAVFGKGGPGG